VLTPVVGDDWEVLMKDPESHIWVVRGGRCRVGSDVRVILLNSGVH
jgi:hypothetical protein